MNAIEKHFLTDFFHQHGAVEVKFAGALVASMAKAETSDMKTLPIYFETKNLASLSVQENCVDLAAIELAHHLAPLFHFPLQDRDLWIGRQMRLIQWIVGAQQIQPHLSNWIGLYIKESAIFGGHSTDLLVGPYLGEVTDHVRIPVGSGICGLAIREERVVNVRDAHQDTRHIACSLMTKSELVIPLYDKEAGLIAELDIDSHKLDAFSAQIEEQYRVYAKSFFQVW